MTITPASAVLVDRRNYSVLLPVILAEMAGAKKVGIDCETEDSRAHPALRAYREAKNKTIFDIHRTTMTGFSIHVGGSEFSYYFNLGHADRENRLSHEEVLPVLQAKPADAIWVAHKAPYELTMFKLCLGFDLVDIVCTLQMAVSAYGPDEYSFRKFQVTPFSGIRPLRTQIIEQFQGYQFGEAMDPEQTRLLGVVIGKESKATWSYNGFVDTIRYGYDLKRCVKSWFGYDMTTFAQVMGNAQYMSELTGPQVVAYGADDAFWVIPLFDKLLSLMSPDLIGTFFSGENPMIHIFSEHWIRGLPIDHEAIAERQTFERAHFAGKLREMRAAIKKLLPFDDKPSEEMMEWQPFYVSAWEKKRKEIVDWVNLGDTKSDYDEVMRCSSAIGSGWAGKKVKGINLGYWQTQRVIMHDLMRAPLIRFKGEISSDSDARGIISKRFEKAGQPDKVAVMSLFASMGEIDQAIKLYINPYSALTDPETGRVHPEITSMLATRRLAASNPGFMQIAKHTPTVYVRGYYKPDQADHVLISADWSAIELVIIADYSGDERMLKVFGQVPYGDLHSGSAASGLAVSHQQGLTEEEFLGFKRGENPNDRELRNLEGSTLTPKEYFGYMRTEVGKGQNFEYWFSGLLANTAEKLGWSGEEMWEAVERFRSLFPEAEAWRVETIEQGCRDGYVTLPDGHRRVKLEATDDWLREWCEKIYQEVGNSAASETFMRLSGKRIQNRSKNQMVNAKVQGLCARLAKDTMISMARKTDKKWCSLFGPIHDELVYSVHKDYAMEFLPIFRETMCDHPKYITKVQLDATVSMGRTFRPFHMEKSPFGQIELDEASRVEGLILPERWGQKLTVDETRGVLDYLTA